MRGAGRRPRAGRTWWQPVRLVPTAYAIVIAAGSLLLMLPAARADDAGPVVMPALFTSVSATCVTGLTTVPQGSHWTGFGHAVILGLVQIGGFGIMTLATLLVVGVAGRLGLRSMLTVQAEAHTLDLGDVRHLMRRIAVIMLAFEAGIAVVLTIRFRTAYDDGLGTALWHGVFHSVSSFNNAGFALYDDSLVRFVADPWICLPLCVGVVAGGLGFPALVELWRRFGSPGRWSVHLRLTVYGTVALLVIGIAAVLGFEWANPHTLGPMSWPDKLLAATTGGVMPRTAGFASIDYGTVSQETLMVTDVLMFIGGGSAGTAGGIKISTFLVLWYVIWAEARGERDVLVGGRTVPLATQRQALTVALLGVAAVVGGTLAVLAFTELRADGVVFEVASAFGTVGLSTGITGDLPVHAQVVLMVLMFVGRVGTITVAAALALSRRHRKYRLPEERPIVG